MCLILLESLSLYTITSYSLSVSVSPLAHYFILLYLLPPNFLPSNDKHFTKHRMLSRECTGLTDAQYTREN